MIITNHLEAFQRAQIEALEAVCRQHDSLQGSIFLSNELNFDPELPCFYLLYAPAKADRANACSGAEELIAALTVFAPFSTEAEIYAYTLPAYRRQGCFNTLLEAALQTLQKYRIMDVLFVCEPSSKAAAAVLRTLEASLEYSEYLLTCPFSEAEADVFHETEGGLCLSGAGAKDIGSLAELHAAAFQERNAAASAVFLSDSLSSGSQGRKLTDPEGRLLGFCFFTAGQRELSVFSVAVHPDYHRRGFAAAMLRALLAELAETYPGLPVTLEVNSRNLPALRLYQKLGFQIATQLDYFYADCDELLELF